MLRLYTFGGLRIEREGQFLQLSTQKARDLLAYLVTFRDRPHPRPVLAGTLWPDLPEGKARRRLSDTLWRVRRVLGDHVMADEERVRFNTEAPYWLDVQEFEAKRQEAESGEQGTESYVLSLVSCIQLYLGPFLDGLYHDWVLLERERLQERYLEALKRLLEYNKQTGDYAEALAIAQRLAAVEPLHEAAHRELMRLYHLLGRDAEAVAQYQRCREILREEMGVDPAPETEALYHTLSGPAPTPPGAPAVHLPTPARRPTHDLDDLPLVGRDAERSALLGLLEAATAGQGGIVLLEGEPGIGKSRLARELIAGARWRNVEAILAGASEGSASSYALLVSALAPALTSLRVRQLIHAMESVHLQAIAPLLPQTAPAVADLPPLPDLPPPQARERLQQAFVALILGLVHIAPFLWVLEDLQWADAETLSLLPLLLPRLRESRALFLLTGRSAELRANPAVWEALQALDRAAPFPRRSLTRLDADDIGNLVNHLLGEDNPALTGRLAQESEGVPLYVVEALKAWRDEDHLLLGERGEWRWRGSAAAASSMQLGAAIIERRLSHLSPAAEEILAAAAAIGAEVDFDLLTCVCAPRETTSGAVDSDLHSPVTDGLLRLGFLVETDTGYRFSHEQVRRAVYRGLSPELRQRLHRRVAQALEALFPEQFERLAQHHIAAGEREPAIHYLERAAERSRELFAHQTTLTIYDRLLSLLTHAEDREARYDILRDRAEVLGWIGDRDAQGRDLGEMLDLAEALSDKVRRARVLHARSEWHRLQGRYEPANEDARAALEIYRQVGDSREQAALLCQLGWNIVYTSAASQAAEYFREALPICKSMGDLRSQLSCLSGLAAAAKMVGDYTRMLSYLQEHIALAETCGDPSRIGRALNNAGIIHYTLGDIEVASTFLQRALQFKETAGDRRSTAFTLVYLGLMDAEHGEFEAAQAHLDTALETFREVQDAPWEGETLGMLGRLALWRGDPAAAGELLQAAYQCYRGVGEFAGAVGALSCLALAELALGDEAAAWQHSLSAIDELEGTALEIEHPQEIYYNHFCVAEGIRRWAAARAALEKAARILDEQSERINDPVLREKYRTGRRFNRDIAEALAGQPSPGRLRVHLARADAPARRRPTRDELVAVIWTVDAGEEDAALAKRAGKVALRRHRLLRLLVEAETAGGLPAGADLAGALDFSPRTIRADLAALRRQGHAVHTRGIQT
ncbi:MAG: AAA family ATPase [Anaerolineae bacterium]|nr:AAA family ATPase [Anaerolineae bacterium]